MTYLTSRRDLEHCRECSNLLDNDRHRFGVQEFLNSAVEEIPHAYEEPCTLVLDLGSGSGSSTLQSRYPGVFTAIWHIVQQPAIIDFPKLNDFGKAFKDAGFKFPKNDEDFIKDPACDAGRARAEGTCSRTLSGRARFPECHKLGCASTRFFRCIARTANNFPTM